MTIFPFKREKGVSRAMVKRIVLGIFAIIVLAIIAAVVTAVLSWSRIPDIISSKLSEKMKVHVEIDDMHIGWKAIDVQKVEIGNPSGSILPKAFSADQILIQAPLMDYLKDDIVIDYIEIDNVYLGLEFESKSSHKGNWNTIMNNMQGGKKAGKAEEPGKTVLIRKLVLTNISVALVYRQGGGPVKNLPPIKRLEFDNLSSEKGIPYEKISKIIFEQMLKSVFSLEGLQNMLQDYLNPKPQDALQNLLQPFKGLLNSAPSEEGENKAL